MAKTTLMLIEDKSSLNYTPMKQLDTVDSEDGSKVYDDGVNYWSGTLDEDLAVTVMPNGILTGGNITPSTADTVDVSSATAWLNGSEVSVSASASEAITRAITNPYIVNAVTIDNTGDIVVLVGTEGTSFSKTIGAAGGAPYIPTDSILVGLIYLTSTTSSIITSTEIKQADGQHKEMARFPTWDVIYEEGTVKFSSPLKLIHTGDVPKKVYASYSEVILSEVSEGGNFAKLLYTDSFKIPEDVYSKSDTNFHDNKTLTDVTSALTGGTWDITFSENAGIGHLMSYAKGDKRYILVYPDQHKTAKFLCPPSLIGFERDAITAEASTVKATVTMMVDRPAIEIP